MDAIGSLADPDPEDLRLRCDSAGSGSDEVSTCCRWRQSGSRAAGEGPPARSARLPRRGMGYPSCKLARHRGEDRSIVERYDLSAKNQIYKPIPVWHLFGRHRLKVMCIDANENRNLCPQEGGPGIWNLFPAPSFHVQTATMVAAIRSKEDRVHHSPALLPRAGALRQRTVPGLYPGCRS